MLISGSSKSFVFFYLIIVFIEFVYFVVMGKFSDMKPMDIIVVVIFNTLFIYILTSSVLYDFRYTNFPKKPKSTYLGIGGSMDEYIWGMFYDYKVIVDRHDRDRMLGITT